MDKTIVAKHLKALNKALGDDHLFLLAMKAMKEERSVMQPEAVGIASKFVAPMSASTSKKLAFEKILERHQSLMSFKRRQRAVGGRSAA